MSASLNGGRPKVLPTALPLPRPRLTVVPKAERGAPRLPFVALVVTVLAAGLVGLLLLNTSMERGAYQVTALRDRVAALGAHRQTLQLEVAARQDPQEVAAKALRLGMVQDASPAFISLATAKVIGVSVPGAPGNGFDIGFTVGPTVDGIGKLALVVAGEANGASAELIEHQATSRSTKGGDTAPASRGTPR